MKFNFADYKGKYAMNCKTEEEAQEFCRLMHEDGRKWVRGNSYLEIINWGGYKSATCYNFNAVTHSFTGSFLKSTHSRIV